MVGEIRGREAYLIWSPFGNGGACSDSACLDAVLYHDFMLNGTGQSCSLAGLVGQIDALMVAVR